MNLVICNQSANYLMVDTARAFVESGKYERIILLVGNSAQVKVAEKYGIEITPITPYNRKNIITRFLSWIKGTFDIITTINRRYKDSEIFIVSNPPTMTIFPRFCSNKYSTLVYDVYPDGIVSGGFVTEKNWIYKLWKKDAINFYKNAQHIYTISDGMKDKVGKYCSGKLVEVVPLWYNRNLDSIDKKDNIFLKEQNLSDNFVVLYSGNIGKGSNLTLLVDIAEKLKHCKNLKFVVIGEGFEKKNVLSSAERKGLDNMIFLPCQPQEILSHSLSAADLAYIAVEEKAGNVCVPSKTFNIIKTGSPILCVAPKNSSIAHLIDSYKIGKVFQQDQVEAICVFIEQLSNDKAAQDSFKENIKSAVDDYSPVNALKYQI